jgi:hypothetical protein
LVLVEHQAHLPQLHQTTMAVMVMIHRLLVKPQQVAVAVVVVMLLSHETVRTVGLVAVVQVTVGLLVLVAHPQHLRGLRAVTVLVRQTIMQVVAVVLMRLAQTQQVA